MHYNVIVIGGSMQSRTTASWRASGHTARCFGPRRLTPYKQKALSNESVFRPDSCIKLC